MPVYVVALAHFTRTSISAAYTETSTMHDVHNVKIIIKCEVKHNGDLGMGHLCLNGWVIYALNGWDSYGKVSYCVLGENAQKMTGLQGGTFSGHCMITG